MKYSIGIDLGGTDIKAGLLSSDGKLMYRVVVSTHVNEGAKAIAKRIATDDSSGTFTGTSQN